MLNVSVLWIVLLMMSPHSAPAPLQDPSVQAIRAQVETFQTAWNAHDPVALSALLTEDADQIMGDGPNTSGRQALQQWWKNRFATMEPGRTITLTVTSVRLITPDVGLLNTIAKTGGADAQGKALPSDTDRGTWVVMKKDGKWFIVALRVYPAEHAP
jgi:uncharacterized protein (TIGR02246 family)